MADLWLSREAWASVAALLVLAPVALSDWLGLGWPRLPGQVGAVLCAGHGLHHLDDLYPDQGGAALEQLADAGAVPQLCSGGGGAILTGDTLAAVLGLLAVAAGPAGGLASGRWGLCQGRADDGHGHGAGPDRGGLGL